jgi:hypothetical protein
VLKQKPAVLDQLQWTVWRESSMKNSWGVQLTSRTTHVNFIRPILLINKYQVRAELFREVVVLLSNICYLLIVNANSGSCWAHVPQQGGRYLT